MKVTFVNLDTNQKANEDKMLTGKMGYMKTMWKWLTQHEWEALEEEMQNTIIDSNNTRNYGERIY